MPPRRNKSLRAVAAEADRVTGPIRRKRGLAEAALMSEWPDIIGAALAGMKTIREFGAALSVCIGCGSYFSANAIISLSLKTTGSVVNR